jgi:small subunit ribosomal protein S19e
LTTVNDVQARTLIEEIAKDLKDNKKVKAPEFAAYVKTGSHTERAPVREDWWYVRMASILRKTYIEGHVTVNALRNYYGGKKRRGVRPPIFRQAGGKIIRTCMQDLEKLGFIKISENKKGRIITPNGQKYIDKIAAKIYKEANPDKKPHVTIKKGKKEETPKEIEE